MTTVTPESKPSFLDRFQKLGSNLFLGLLVTALSVFTAATNYATYQASGASAGYDTEGSRLLANSNTEYIRATQFIIQDYTMYDLKFRHDFGQGEASKLDNKVAQTKSRKEGFHEQVYTSFEICTKII